MSARLTLLLALVVLGIVRSAPAADSEVAAFSPEKYEISRYKKIWERSPFIVETKVETQSVGLAARYSLVGLVESGDDSVAFLNDAGKTVMISKKRPDLERNLELVAIMADKDFRKSRVTIRQGDEKADLPFDPSGAVSMGASPAMDTAAVPPPPTGVINRPGARAPSLPGAAPVVPDGQPVPTAQRRIIAPGTPAATSPGAAIPAPSASSTNAPAPPAATRRIIRPNPIDVSN